MKLAYSSSSDELVGKRRRPACAGWKCERWGKCGCVQQQQRRAGREAEETGLRRVEL